MIHVFVGSDQTVLSGNVDACAVGVYQALLSAYEKEPAFEAIRLIVIHLAWIRGYLAQRYNMLSSHTPLVSVLIFDLRVAIFMG